MIQKLFFLLKAHQLTQVELVRRSSGAFKPAFDIINYDSTIPSFLREKYQMLYGDFIQHLKVDMTILDYNYTRLNKYMGLASLAGGPSFISSV